jgi:hypothetical protein
MRTLEEAERAGKFRYVVNVLSQRLLDGIGEEEIALFFRARAALAGEGHRPKISFFLSLLLRYLGHLLRPNPLGRVRCAVDWLCAAPSSTAPLRLLFRLSAGLPALGTLRIAAGLALPPEALGREERLELCRRCLRLGRCRGAEELAQSVLRDRPDDGEARHLLWSALLQSSGEFSEGRGGESAGGPEIAANGTGRRR